MKLSFTFILLLSGVFSSFDSKALDRYWVHKPFYENTFSTAAELADWQLVEDAGSGSWVLSGNGTAILTMDNFLGGYANRLFNKNGAAARLLPLDKINGRVEFMVKAITGGNQRIFVQVEQYNAANVYLGQSTILPAQSATGFFYFNLSNYSWNAAADKVRFIIGGENYSAAQGTVEFDYFSYSNNSGVWNNTANWSSASNGAGGASVPGAGDMAIFNGAGGNNGSCLLSGAVTVSSIQLTSGYSGNLDLQGYQLTAGSVSIAGGGVTGNGAAIYITGNVAISGGAYKNTNGSNYVNGDIAITGGVLDFSTGNVIFNAAGNQQFSSTLTNPIHKLIVDKPSGIVSFSSDILVSDSLVLTQGILQSNSYVIRLGTSASNTGKLITGTGKINGSFLRWMAPALLATIDFPLGNATVSAPIRLDVSSVLTTGGTIKATYTDATPSFTAVNFMDGLSAITSRSVACWTLQATGISGGMYTLAATNNNLNAIGSLGDLHLTLAGGVNGIHSAATGTLSNPTISRNMLSVTNISNTWYASSASIVLPVNWLSFNATENNGIYSWKWSVSSEQQADRYEPQYSTDGIHFTSAGNIKALSAGNYIFEKNIAFTGPVMLRVMAVDRDGKISYSAIKKTGTAGTSTFSFYPHPVIESIHISWPYPDAGELNMVITDMTGAMIKSTHTAYKSAVLMSVQGIMPGTYFMQCSDEKGRSAIKRIVITSH